MSTTTPTIRVIVHRGHALAQTRPGVVTVTTPDGNTARVLAKLTEDHAHLDAIIRAAGDRRTE